jgi:hypothetical protein
MVRPNISQRISGELRNELRRTIALKTYAHVCGKKEKKTPQQRNMIEQMYRGTPTIASHLDLMIQGTTSSI